MLNYQTRGKSRLIYKYKLTSNFHNFNEFCQHLRIERIQENNMTTLLFFILFNFCKKACEKLYNTF